MSSVMRRVALAAWMFLAVAHTSYAAEATSAAHDMSQMDHSHHDHFSTRRPGDSDETATLRKAVDSMRFSTDIFYSGDTDLDVVNLLISEGEGVVGVAKVEEQYGTDPKIKDLVKKLAETRQKEVELLKTLQEKHKSQTPAKKTSDKK